MTRRFLHAAALAAGALSAGAIVSPAAAAETGYVDFPMCSPSVTTSCIHSLEVDVTGTGEFTAPPSELRPTVTLSGTRPPVPDVASAGLSIDVRRGGSLQDLSPVLTPESRLRVSVDIGPFTPDRLMFASADVLEWTSRPTAAGTSVHTFVMRPISKTIGIPCSVGEGCDGPFTLLTDYAAIAQLNLMDLPSAFPAQQEMDQQSEGSWVASNASASTNAYMDVDANALRVDVASPHLTAAGVQNVGFLAGFVPDALITGSFQTTPEALAERGILTSTDDGATETIAASVTRVEGGVVFRATGFHYSTPSFAFRARRAAGFRPLTIAPARDAVAPHRFTVRGSITASGRFTAASCRGTVALTAKVGTRTVTGPAARLRLVGDRCEYRGSVTVARRGAARTAVIQASFAGNTFLAEGRAPGRKVRLT